MAFVDLQFSEEDRYSLGTDTTTGRHYISIPVSNGVLDYEEYYTITSGQLRTFLSNRDEALQFADACRRRDHDGLLIIQPGWNRGTPT